MPTSLPRPLAGSKKGMKTGLCQAPDAA
jgi:hypothetical protein